MKSEREREGESENETDTNHFIVKRVQYTFVQLFNTCNFFRNSSIDMTFNHLEFIGVRFISNALIKLKRLPSQKESFRGVRIRIRSSLESTEPQYMRLIECFHFSSLSKLFLASVKFVKRNVNFSYNFNFIYFRVLIFVLLIIDDEMNKLNR